MIGHLSIGGADIAANFLIYEKSENIATGTLGSIFFVESKGLPNSTTLNKSSPLIPPDVSINITSTIFFLQYFFRAVR